MEKRTHMAFCLSAFPGADWLGTLSLYIFWSSSNNFRRFSSMFSSRLRDVWAWRLMQSLLLE